MLAVLGPSGCGKTSLLRVLAGLLCPSSGEILFNGVNVTDIPPEARKVAVVFQKPLLFSNMSVGDNIAFGLKMRKVAQREIDHRVEEALQLVELGGYQLRRPKELSGGQEQRVALARALVTRPDVLLLDEPFSALDTALRGRMRSLVKSLQQQMELTTVFVTHDQDEAAYLADRIALLLNGSFEQRGSVQEVFSAPTSAGAATLLGWKTLHGFLCQKTVTTALGDFRVQGSTAPAAAARPCVLAFHPMTVALLTSKAEKDENTVRGVIDAAISQGTHVRYIVRVSSGDILEITGAGQTKRVHSVGDEVLLHLPAESLRVY
jgi:ABC-type Fe3+/spermidine/putrescine transport system ATPase subunit